MSKSHKFGHSMNRTGRKVELQRITAENQKILRRLQTVQPVYSHWKWEEDRIKSEKYLETISEFKSSRKPPGGVAGRHSSAEGYTTGEILQGNIYKFVCRATSPSSADFFMFGLLARTPVWIPLLEHSLVGGIDMGGGGAAYDDRDGSRRGYDEMRASEEFGGPSYGMGHGASAPALMAPGRGHGGMATSEYDRAVLGAEDASGAYYADSKTGGTSRGDETGTMGGHDGAGGGYARGGMGASYSRGSLGAAGARAIGGGGMGGTEDGGGGGERSWGAGHSRGGL